MRPDPTAAPRSPRARRRRAIPVRATLPPGSRPAIPAGVLQPRASARRPGAACACRYESSRYATRPPAWQTRPVVVFSGVRVVAVAHAARLGGGPREVVHEDLDGPLVGSQVRRG